LPNFAATLPARGLTRLYNPEFKAWADMKTRCYNKNYKRFDDYGGRGIRISKRWFHSFRSFLIDMGPRPSKIHSLDRINNDGNYTKKNCRWATDKQQCRNNRRNIILEHEGEKHCMAEWSAIKGIRADTIYTRIKRGWSISDALNYPERARLIAGAATYTHEGITKTVRQWAKKLFARPGIVDERLRMGWSVEKALFTPVLKTWIRHNGKPV